jgi:ribosomal-protein-alanine N-acetyltransferase
MRYIRHMRVPTLATKRLVLRPPSPGDIDDVAALFGDSEVTRFVLNGRTLTPVQAAHTFEGLLSEARHGPQNPATPDGVSGWLIMVRPDTQEFVGTAIIRLLPSDLAAAIGNCPDPAIEVGYIFAKAFWGQGLATEAAQELTRYAVSLVGKEHVVAVAHVGNEPSHTVLRKAGFTNRGEYDFRDMRMNYWTLP